MEKLTETLLDLMTRAAALRAAGSTWPKVAQELKKSVETCRHWPARYPDTWRRLFRRAAAERSAEGGADAQTALLILVRHDDAKVRLRAAELLQRAWQDQMDREDRAERPDPIKVAVEIAEFARLVKGLPDDQVARHLAEYLARSQPDRDGGPATKTD